jgi:ribosome-associated protein
MAIKKVTKPIRKKTTTAGSKKSGAPVKKAVVKKSNKAVSALEKEQETKEANVLANLDKQRKTGAKRPKKKATTKQTMDLLDAIVEGMKERKAKNITVLNLKGIENRVSDYFVICDADSNTHVNSIADSIEETVEKLNGERAFHTEGHQNGEWILIDYINIVTHVFQREFRDHYNLEGLWGDAEITNIN